MTRSSRYSIVALCLAAGVLTARPAVAQIAIPPALLKQQADRASKDDAATDSAKPATSRPVKPQYREQLAALKSSALGNDPAAAVDAIRALRAMGKPAEPTLREAVKELVARDHAALDNAGSIASLVQLRELSDRIAAERAAARLNIDKLAHDQTIQIAHQHYGSLKESWSTMSTACAAADGVIRALSRRADLVRLYHQLLPGDKQYTPDSESKLIAKVQRQARTLLTAANALPQYGASTASAPTDSFLRDMYFYRACRRIEDYNATVQQCMSDGELLNATLVNTYREYLGILPYEYNPRLVASARGHSQEMVDLKYFAHESPTPANKTPWDRIKSAGYKGGSGENIAMGTSSGEGAFWMWFDSPGHHQNIASLTSTAIGVGNVGVHWTQNMGSGPRVMPRGVEQNGTGAGN